MQSNRWTLFGTVAAVLVAAVMLMGIVPTSVAAPPVGAGAPPAHAPSSATPATIASTHGATIGHPVTSTSTFGTTTTSVGPSASVRPTSGSGPHPGTLDIYEAAGGGTTVDPASAYYTVNAEPIWNVYETLLAYNGSATSPLPSGFVPQLGTCVPGSSECQAQFGVNLAYANASNASNTQYYTFEIDANARFYDPATGASWPVYPSDVLFSFARTFSFADLPGVATYPGWIQAQSVLPPGNAKWDGGIHNPYNNTPSRVLSSILVNDSAYCPTPLSSSLHTNGCVTFNVGPSGLPWPYMLELLADPMGGSVEPCGTFTYLGAGVPGFAGTHAASGDGSCLLPGNAHASTDAAFQSYVTAVSPTLWDTLQRDGAANYPSAQPAVKSTMIGSGPYYASSIDLASGYFLKANPAYHVPQGCAGQAGCLPAPGVYIPNVNVYWSNGDTLGLQEMTGGYSDSSAILPSEFPTLKNLVATGTYGLLQNEPTLSVFFNPFQLNFSVSAEQQIDSTGQLNIPGDFFSSVAVRQFVANAMPYTSLINNVYTSAGIATGEAYGGVIPHNMGNYYPANVSWPAGNPVSDPTTVGNVAWWWHEAVTPGTQWYDPAAAACTSGSPCRFPVISVKGLSNLDDQANLLIASITSLSGGAVKPYLVDILGSTEVGSLGLPPGSGNMPIYSFGWAPDYPDPTDYISPMYGPDNTYTYTDAVAEQFALAAYNDATACTQYNTAASFGTFAALAYWANLGQVPNACQGFAYSTMTAWIDTAAHLTNIPQREVDYNLIEHIANELALYTYTNQGINVIDYGSWIDPAGINLNPMIGGGGDQLWAFWSYAQTTYPVTFTESGLTTGTNWSVTLGPTTQSSTSASIEFPAETNGTYNFSVAYESGFNASPSNGSLVINGALVNQPITYSAVVGVPVAVYFNMTGLVSNTTWSVVVHGAGTVFSNRSSLKFDLLPLANYSYAAQLVGGYTGPSPANVTVGATSTVVAVPYAAFIVPTYRVTFDEVGLPSGTNWSITLGSAGSAYLAWSTTSAIAYYETNGTYGLTIHAPVGYVASSVRAKVSVNGDNVTVQVDFAKTAAAYSLQFNSTGLPAGVLWNITIANLSLGSTTANLAYTLPNGTYSWVSSTVPGFIVASGSKNGSAVVAGATVYVNVSFRPFTYAVTFFEGGLATGAMWNLTVNGTATTPTSSYFIALNLTNGTVPFTVTGPSNYSALPSSGNLTVAGNAVTQVIVFGPKPAVYVITFSTSTLPSGAAWTVDFGTSSKSGTGSSFDFNATNGTWTYTVIAPAGYTATPGGGQLQVLGGASPTTIVFSQNATAASPAWSSLSPLAYGLVGTFALLAVIGFLLATVAWRRRKGNPAPPESWSEGPAAEPKGTPPADKPKT